MNRSRREKGVAARVIQLDGNEVAYVFRRSAQRRSIGLKVDQAGLTVSAPPWVSRAVVENTLREEARWVLEKITQWARLAYPRPQWVDGEKLPYLGGYVELQLGPPARKGQLALNFADRPTLTLACADEDVEAQVLAWYRERAWNHFIPRVKHFARQLGVAMPKVLLTNARSRWGSCNAIGEIRLNWRLIKASPQEIDYLVAHELAHLRQMDHSPAFWGTVASIYPGYKEASRKLDENDLRYRTF